MVVRDIVITFGCTGRVTLPDDFDRSTTIHARTVRIPVITSFSAQGYALPIDPDYPAIRARTGDTAVRATL